MDVKFTKMHGAGNDFVVVDEWAAVVIPDESKEDFVRKVSDRHFGVGSDGVIFVQKSGKADAKFVFHNPDGSRAEMCGNGIRCFAKYLYERGYVRDRSFKAETLAGLKEVGLIVQDGVVTEVRVDMGAPQVRRGEAQVAGGDPEEQMVGEEIEVGGQRYSVTAVGMGNPHAILFVEDSDSVDVKATGSAIRNHLSVWPKGVNVHFLQELGPNEFKVRTFERGVEDETLACGTGICASAVAAVLAGRGDVKSGFVFRPRGGVLKVDFRTDRGGISRVFLTGSAVAVFEGVYSYGG